MIGGPIIGDWHHDDEDGERVRYDAMGLPAATVYRSAYEERGAGWYRRPHLPPVMVDEVDIPTAMATCDRGLAEWAELTATAAAPEADRAGEDEQALIDAWAAFQDVFEKDGVKVPPEFGLKDAWRAVARALSAPAAPSEDERKIRDGDQCMVVLQVGGAQHALQGTAVGPREPGRPAVVGQRGGQVTREETFVRLLNLGIPVAEVEAALAAPKAAIDRYEAAVLFLREYDAGLPTLDGATRSPTDPVRSEGRTRMECLKCHQWSTYGTSCIGPCVGSAWKGVGRKDPAHNWQNVPWPEDDMPPLGVVEDRTTAQLVADGDWRPKVGDRVIATRAPGRDSLFMLWALDAREACSSIGGVVREEDDCDGLSFRVEHANGEFAWWAADELRPET